MRASKKKKKKKKKKTTKLNKKKRKKQQQQRRKKNKNDHIQVVLVVTAADAPSLSESIKNTKKRRGVEEHVSPHFRHLAIEDRGPNTAGDVDAPGAGASGKSVSTSVFGLGRRRPTSRSRPRESSGVSSLSAPASASCDVQQSVAGARGAFAHEAHVPWAPRRPRLGRRPRRRWHPAFWRMAPYTAETTGHAQRRARDEADIVGAGRFSSRAADQRPRRARDWPDHLRPDDDGIAEFRRLGVSAGTGVTVAAEDTTWKSRG